MADMVRAADSLNEAITLVVAIEMAAADLSAGSQRNTIQYVAGLALDKADEAKKLLSRHLAE